MSDSKDDKFKRDQETTQEETRTRILLELETYITNVLQKLSEEKIEVGDARLSIIGKIGVADTELCELAEEVIPEADYTLDQEIIDMVGDMAYNSLLGGNHQHVINLNKVLTHEVLKNSLNQGICEALSDIVEGTDRSEYEIERILRDPQICEILSADQLSYLKIQFSILRSSRIMKTLFEKKFYPKEDKSARDCMLEEIKNLFENTPLVGDDIDILSLRIYQVFGKKIRCDIWNPDLLAFLSDYEKLEDLVSLGIFPIEDKESILEDSKKALFEKILELSPSNFRLISRIRGNTHLKKIFTEEEMDNIVYNAYQYKISTTPDYKLIKNILTKYSDIAAKKGLITEQQREEIFNNAVLTLPKVLVNTLDEGVSNRYSSLRDIVRHDLAEEDKTLTPEQKSTVIESLYGLLYSRAKQVYANSDFLDPKELHGRIDTRFRIDELVEFLEFSSFVLEIAEEGNTDLWSQLKFQRGFSKHYRDYTGILRQAYENKRDTSDYNKSTLLVLEKCGHLLKNIEETEIYDKLLEQIENDAKGGRYEQAAAKFKAASKGTLFSEDRKAQLEVDFAQSLVDALLPTYYYQGPWDTDRILLDLNKRKILPYSVLIKVQKELFNGMEEHIKELVLNRQYLQISSIFDYLRNRTPYCSEEEYEKLHYFAFERFFEETISEHIKGGRYSDISEILKILNRQGIEEGEKFKERAFVLLYNHFKNLLQEGKFEEVYKNIEIIKSERMFYADDKDRIYTLDNLLHSHTYGMYEKNIEEDLERGSLENIQLLLSGKSIHDLHLREEGVKRLRQFASERISRKAQKYFDMGEAEKAMELIRKAKEFGLYIDIEQQIRTASKKRNAQRKGTKLL